MKLNNFLRRDGMVAGIAGGLAHALDVPAWIIRILLFVSFFMSFGITFLCYVAGVFSFPTEEYYRKYGDGPKALGVCYRLAPKFDISPGWFRFLTLLATLITGLFPVPVIYFVVHLVTGESKSASANNSFRDVN